MMYHKNLAVAVWAGNNDNTPSPGGWSTTVPLPIANSFMTRLAGKYKPESFTRPAGVVATSVCNDTGAIAGKNADCKKVPSIYITGKAPKPDKRESFYVCKVEDKIPPDVSFAREHGLAEKAILLDKELENKLQQSNFERYLENAKGTKYFFEKPGTAECSVPLGKGNAPSVEITSPSDGSSIGRGESLTISAVANAKGAVSSVAFYFDNVLIETDTSSPYNITYTVANDEDLGGHGIKAVVTDNNGKTSTDSISVNVTTDSVSVSVTSPTNSENIPLASFPYTLEASTTGSGVSSVRFLVDGSVVGTDSDGSNGWSATWNSALAGAHTVKAIATKNGIDYESSPVTVTVL
jgi:hypothetical protein